jgi:hypothetical protein
LIDQDLAAGAQIGFRSIRLIHDSSLQALAMLPLASRVSFRSGVGQAAERHKAEMAPHA